MSVKLIIIIKQAEYQNQFLTEEEEESFSSKPIVVQWPAQLPMRGSLFSTSLISKLRVGCIDHYGAYGDDERSLQRDDREIPEALIMSDWGEVVNCGIWRLLDGEPAYEIDLIYS